MVRDIIEKNEKVNPNADLLKKLKSLIPGVIAKDGSIDADAIRYWAERATGDSRLVTEERETFNFLGKDYARLLYALDTETVITPDKENNAKSENKNSENLYLSGDNLEVLKHLRRSYEGEVKCIYIDPPYNTGSDDFVYNDSFDFTEKDLKEKLGLDDDAQVEKIMNMRKRGSRSHAAWLTFMYPRLKLARDLLKDDGVIFISIDDNEQANLKILCDEIFGEENFCGIFPWRKRTAKSDVPFGISQDYEYVVVYARTVNFKAGIENDGRKYYETEDFPDKPWRVHDMTTQRTAAERPNCFFTIINPKTKEKYPCNPNRVWANNEETFEEYYNQGRIVFPGDYDFLKISKPVIRYWKEDDMKKAGEDFGKIAVSTKFPDFVGMSEDGTKEIAELFETKVFLYPKPTSLIKHLLKISTRDCQVSNEAPNDASSSQDIILDFFSGSGTTAHALMQLNAEDDGNRKYIMVQQPAECPKDKDAFKAGYKTIDQIGMERIRRAAAKIKEEHPDSICDFGFKHYTIQKPAEKSLDTIKKFVPNPSLGESTILKQFGAETVLATWMVDDGHKFNANVEKINLNDYTAYKVNDYLYLIDCGIDGKHIKELFKKYDEDKTFKPKHIVLFGYSFGMTTLDTLKANIKNVDGIDIHLEIRY